MKQRRKQKTMDPQKEQAFRIAQQAVEVARSLYEIPTADSVESHGLTTAAVCEHLIKEWGLALEVPQWSRGRMTLAATYFLTQQVFPALVHALQARLEASPEEQARIVHSLDEQGHLVEECKRLRRGYPVLRDADVGKPAVLLQARTVYTPMGGSWGWEVLPAGTQGVLVKREDLAYSDGKAAFGLDLGDAYPILSLAGESPFPVAVRT